MMTIRDSVLLAAAKLKTHRVRTGIILVVASLLFASIVLVLTLATGMARSMQSFSGEGLSGRYIVRAVPIYDSKVWYAGTAEIIETLKLRTDQLKAEKKSAAKKLDISYDAASDNNLPVQEIKDGSGNVQHFINASNAETKTAIDRYLRSLENIGYEDFRGLAQRAGAENMYRSSQDIMSAGFSPSTSQQQSSVIPIVDGKEQTSNQTSESMSEPRGVGGIYTTGITYFDSELMLPFVLPGQNLALGKDGSVPVIAPVSAVEQVLGLQTLSYAATTSQRLDRVVQIRKDIAGKTFDLCYRNGTSNALVQQARDQEKEVDANEGKVNYTAPALQYASPSTPCGPVTIKKDTRSAEEKKHDTNQEAFKRAYESYEDPDQQIVRVRIVGLSQDISFGSAGFNARGLLEGMLRSGLGLGWFVPANVVADGSVLDKIQPNLSKLNDAQQYYYAEFTDLAAAKQFAESVGCDSRVTAAEEHSINIKDPRVVDCYGKGKYFDTTSFGNNASAIADLRNKVWGVVRYVAPVVLLLSSLVLMGIVGKIVADSRRETAVFRALGATRLTVAQIYLTYSLFIAGFITILAFSIGMTTALIISNKLTPEASVTAVLAYNAQDVNKQFTFFGVDPVYALIILALIVLASLLSAVLPLLTNMRRNPIRDMRDEG